MLTVIAYDIADDRRRNGVSNLLADHGVRVNYSVFECELEGDELERLQGQLSQLIEDREDRIVFYRLCEGCRLRKSGMGLSRKNHGGERIVIL